MSNENIRQSLKLLGDAIESIANAPQPSPVIADRSISGNKLNGGIYANFRSVGIKDTSTFPEVPVLVIENEQIVAPAIKTNLVNSQLTVAGDLTVKGEITAKKLHVDEISADIRNERSSPLEFKSDKGGIAYGKGLIWPGGDYTRQLALQSGPDRIFSSESIDVNKDKDYRINNRTVLTETALGDSIVDSNLQSVGRLNSLAVDGPFSVDNFMYWDCNSQRLGIGIEAPNGAISVGSLEHEFIVDYDEVGDFKLGTWTTSSLDIITDDTTRISIGENGGITLHDKVSVSGRLGINVKNFSDDVDFATAGAIRIQGKKQEVGSNTPTSGSYKLGDIVWNNSPKPTGYVGWICVREGAPGEWNPLDKYQHKIISKLQLNIFTQRVRRH